jgi:hypothetical protein
MFETIKSSCRWSSGSLYAAVASLLLIYVSAVARGQKAPNSPNLEQRNRFDGSTTLLDKTGRTETIHATIRQWVVSGHQPVRDFPEQGLLLVQLRAGKVITVIDGKEERRVSSDFWVVPSKAKMSVQVTGESANLDVLALDIR